MRVQFVKMSPLGICKECGDALTSEDDTVHGIERDMLTAKDTTLLHVGCFAKATAQKPYPAEFYHRIHKDGETLWNVDSLRLGQEIAELFDAEITSVLTKR